MPETTKGFAMPKPDTQNFIQVSHKDDRNLSAWAITPVSQHARSQEAASEQNSQVSRQALW